MKDNIPVIRQEDFRAPRKTAWQMFKEQLKRFFHVKSSRPTSH